MTKDYLAIKAENFPNLGESRYIIIDNHTGEVLDDAQGYGYRTAQNAYRAYAFKQNGLRESQLEHREDAVDDWMLEHLDFVRYTMAVKEEVGDKFSLSLLTTLLNIGNYKIDFPIFSLYQKLK